MKKMIFVALIILQSIHPLFGLLSPLSESIVEIRTLINSPELTQLLRQDDTIQKIEKGLKGYLITTSQTKISVDLIPKRLNMPGAQQFDLRFSIRE